MKNNMNEELKGSDTSGNPEEEKVEESNVEEKKVTNEQYKELEVKLGEQGKELGDFRTFVDEVTPLLDKLQSQPEVVEAILSGKINAQLAKSVSEGKFKIEDAVVTAEAHKEVKKDLGSKKYKDLSVEDVEKLIQEKAEEIVSAKVKGLDAKINQHKETRDYEDSVNAFLKNTPDFSEYAEEVRQWYKDHPDQYDIEIAYNAVKGRRTTSELSTKKEEDAVEEAKRIASGLSEGGSINRVTIKDKALIDELVSSNVNPNSL